MKILKFLAPLSALGLCAALGITISNNINAQDITISENIKLANKTTLDDEDKYADSYVHILTDWCETAGENESLELGGFKYILNEAGTVDVYESMNAATTKKVVFLPNIYTKGSNKTINYTLIEPTNYTNVEDVLIIGTKPLSRVHTFVNELSNKVDLYTCGDVTNLEKYTNINDAYVCDTYDSMSANNLSLESLHVKNLYIAPWAKRYYGSEIKKFTNADGDEATMLFANDSDISYSRITFLPSIDCTLDTVFAGCRYSDLKIEFGNNTSVYGHLQARFTSISSDFKTFILKRNMFLSNTLTSVPDTLVVENLYSLDEYDSGFFEGKTIIVKNAYISTLNFKQFSGAKEIRFLSVSSSQVSELQNQSFVSNIEKIVIQDSDTSKFTTLLADELLGSKVVSQSMTDDYDYVMTLNNKDYKIKDLTTHNLETLKTASINYASVDLSDVYLDEYITTNGVGTPPVTPEVPSDIEFKDDDKWKTGYNTLGTIFYSSDKDLSEILKIAAYTSVYKDGILQSPDDYKISFDCNYSTGELTIVIKDSSDKIVQAVSTQIRKCDETKYGEFIYVSMLGTYDGTLYTNIDSTRDTNLNELYEYVIKEASYADLLGKFSLEEKGFSEESIQEVSTYLRHKNSGNYYHVNTNVCTQDYSLFEDVDNITITLSGLISPDDEIVDVDTEYEISYATNIYVPNTLKGNMLIHNIKDHLVKLNNEKVDVESLYVETISNHYNDYTFKYSFYLPDNNKVEKTVKVTVIDTNYKMGLVKMSDDKVYAISPYQENYNEEEVVSAIKDVMKKALNVENVIAPSNFSLTGTKDYTGFTYSDSKELTYINSGLSFITNSDIKNPIDESKLKEGYKILGNIVYSSNYNLEDVIKVVGKNLLLNNGVFVTEDYKVISTIYKNTVGFEIYIKDKKVSSGQFSYKEDTNSNNKFIYATSTFHTGYLFIEQGQTSSLKDIHDYVITNYMNANTPPTFNNALDLNAKGDTTIKGVIDVAGSFYNYETKVEVETLDNKLTTTNVELDNKTDEEMPNKPSDDNKDDESNKDNIIDDFKDKLENNKAFKVSMYVISTIFGIILIYGAYLLIRKFVKWLKH